MNYNRSPNQGPPNGAWNMNSAGQNSRGYGQQGSPNNMRNLVPIQTNTGGYQQPPPQQVYSQNQAYQPQGYGNQPQQTTQYRPGGDVDARKNNAPQLIVGIDFVRGLHSS